ncbi:type II CAAX endopeptidase family protein [Lactobacillus sp. ESL0681]|uniref:CPBP family intramembrane glutamic endopeptidase n=1 Tax=Lactobacillus sp. ESL0681 TaxID=2983211 RepID=UPI0023FA3E65|nr:type II CAAX endopeptidase family protein [Lactobacillus sp. ESL0681]WEV39820.1 type II CAAX endopeptidase family protein [Lactobacillus sp. ESL0681]
MANLIKQLLKLICKLIIFGLLFILIQIPTLGEAFLPGETPTKFNFLLHIGITLFSTIIILWFVTIFYHSLNHKPIFSKTNLVKNYSFAACLAMLSQVLQSYIALISKTNDNDTELFMISKSRLAPILMVTLIFISPLLEELLWQGALQGGILKSFNPFFTILITGLLFALAHGYSFSYDTLQLFCSGLAYAITYYHTGDWGTAIFCHGLSNFIVYSINFIF